MAVSVPFKLESCLIKPNDYSIIFPDGQTKLLQPKFIHVLAYLAAQFPRLVTREELIEEVWDGNFPVGEKALTNAIWNLRNEFKQFDNINLETVRRKGYRLLTKPEYIQPLIDSNDESDPAKAEKKQSNGLGKKVLLVALALVTFILVWQLSLLPFATKSSKILNLTSEPGREVYPTVSPNERYLIFTWRHITGSPNLYIKDLQDKNSSSKQITFTENYEGHAVWHPNSEVVFFQRKHWDFKRCDVVQLNIVTMLENKIATCDAEKDFSLTISSDGRFLAYIVKKQNDQHLNVKLIDLKSEAMEAKLLACHQKCRFQDLDVAFSPDSKQLALSRSASDGMNEDLFLYDLNTQQMEYLVATKGRLRGLTWHPNGDRIIYGGEESGRRNGYLVSLKDKSTINLNVDGFSYPSFVPNSHEVVYHSRENITKLSTLDLSETTGATLFPLIHSNYIYKDPHYSEENNSIVFISTESGYEEIWRADPDGSNRKQLTKLKRHLSSPRWSHNGQSIAFFAPDKKTKRSALFVLNLQEGNLTQLDSEFDQYYRPSWLRDDSGLLAGAKFKGNLALYGFPIDEKPPYIIIDQAVTYAEQARNGDVWFSKGRNLGLWRYTPGFKADKPIQVLNNNVFQVEHHWELTEDGVFFQHDYANYHQIQFFDFHTQEISPLVKLPFGTISRKSSITYIPSQNKLVIAEQEFVNTDIKQLSHPSL
ncbi:transcriptional regulator domain-containing protein (plasmid) [Glaciecola sp. 4H-3-7+YE-5]|nr:transcriptional regulator domain-containing protein [Glaciecola sp. 4H-3-7+YE-5]|tara:strand:- start:13622 stop:15742 length:2121 start_codon:yes stop_codon:yes gene_type:complete